MARKRIKPLDLSKEVDALLAEYGEKVYDVLADSVEEVAKGSAEKLRGVDHFAPNRTPSGRYSKSWDVERSTTGRVRVKYIVHNEEYYQLTHLLENGHVSRNGTHRTFGRVPAYPHIAPVNEWANDELQRQVKQRIEKL